MKLSKNDFRGTGSVFSFTLRQMFCNKANIISVVVTSLLLLFSMPVMTLLGGMDMAETPEAEAVHKHANTESELPAKVYILNETPLELDFSSDPSYADTEFVAAQFKADAYQEHMDAADGFVHIYMTAEGFMIDVDSPAPYEIAAYAELVLNDAISEYSAGAEIMQMPYTIESYTEAEYGEESLEFGMDSYFIQLIYSIVVMIVSIYAAAFIVQSVVEEKTSKLVETLMISVKPLALILGKILAAMLYVFAVAAINITAGALSAIISGKISGSAGTLEMLEEMGISFADLNLTPLTLAVVIISLLLGYLTYSLIAGMSGAGCSQAEDIQSANSTSIGIVMLCYTVAMVTTTMQSQTLAVTTSLIPFLSIFCAPVQYMMGNIGIGLLAVSWLLQMIIVCFLAYMCAKIYEDLIIYKGKRLTFVQIIKMALGKKNREVM